MDHQIKMAIVNSLMDVVKKSPTMLNPRSMQNITRASFDSWLNYVISVLQIYIEYINTTIYFKTINHIQSIAHQENLSYAQKSTEICDIILNLAREVLNY